MIKMWFDGAYEISNGSMGIGVVIERDGKEIYTKSEKMPRKDFPKHSNNVAEYLAVLDGMKYLLANNLHKESIIIYGDSQLVINQMIGKFQIRNGVYKPWAKEAYQLTWKFSNLLFEWVPRELNTRCDDLSKSKI